MRAVRFVVAIGLLYAAASCGGKASVNQASAPPCETRVPAVHPADTVTVVVFDKINLTHAPGPQNRSERFVFSHLYQTLVNVDCHGVVQPGIASSWKKASDGWYIEIDEDAHFWDDKPVTADDVKASFDLPTRHPTTISTVDIIDETHLILHWRNEPFDIGILALPMFSIARQPDISGVAMGTGAWRVSGENNSRGDIMMRPVEATKPIVRVVETDPSRAMDMAGGKADAMITDDPAVIDYVRNRPNTTLDPLVWDVAYVLVSRSRLPTASGTYPDLPVSMCNSFARDAVQVDARGGTAIVAQAPRVSTGGVIVDGIDPNANRYLREPQQLIYDASDRTARDLAERVVSVVSTDTTSSEAAKALHAALPGVSSNLRAHAVEKSSFEQELQGGADFAYMVRLSWDADFPFFAKLDHEHVMWLYGGWSLSDLVLPLIETRGTFIRLTDRIGIVGDNGGDVRLIPPGVERVR